MNSEEYAESMSNVPQEADEELMLAYASGDAEAFRSLYERYERQVYNFCLRYVGDPDMAADLLQETFIKIIEARRRYRSTGRFSGWLFSIARNLCIDRLRAGEREQVAIERTGQSKESPWYPEPAKATASALVQRNELVTVALTSLPVAQREVLLLSKYHGFSYREIAAMVSSTEAAVKQQVYRALKSLREQFASGPEEAS